MKQELVTDKLRKQLYTESVVVVEDEDLGKEPVAVCKFVVPWSRRAWYAFKFDGERFYGVVQNSTKRELSYFNLSELLSLRVKRVKRFKPTLLSELL